MSPDSSRKLRPIWLRAYRIWEEEGVTNKIKINNIIIIT